MSHELILRVLLVCAPVETRPRAIRTGFLSGLDIGKTGKNTGGGHKVQNGSRYKVQNGSRYKVLFGPILVELAHRNVQPSILCHTRDTAPKYAYNYQTRKHPLFARPQTVVAIIMIFLKISINFSEL